MNRLWLFVHLLGFTMWLGGAFASMVAGISSKREDRAALGAVARAQAAIHKAVIGPGAILAVLSGIILTFSVTAAMGELTGFSFWLVLMQGAGVVGALLVLLISVPTAAKVGRVDPTGQTAAYFDELRQRQRIVGSIAGVLGLIALVAGTMVG